jgi:hypothetical protein
MSDNESAGRISWDLAFAQCMRLMQFENNNLDASQGQDSIDLLEKLILRYQKNIMIKFMEKIESYYYTLTHWLIVNRLMLKLYNDIKVVLKLVGI